MEAAMTTAVVTPISVARDAADSNSASVPHVIRAKASFLLSEAGRKASLLAGRSGRERQRLRVAVPTHRLHLVTVDPAGVPRLKLRPRYELKGERVIRIDTLPIFDHPPTPDELLLAAARNYELEQRWHTQRASQTLDRREAQDRREEIAKAFLADSKRRAMTHPTPSPAWCCLMTDQGRMLFDATKGTPTSRRVPAEAHRRFQSDLRARRWKNQQTRAAQEALHEEKKRFVAEWILSRGTPDQQARHRAGVLPMEEAIEAMTDTAFAAARDFRLYPHDGAALLQEHLRRCPEFANATVGASDLAHAFSDAKSSTAAQWARVQAIQTALPAAKVTLRFHRLAWRKDPGASPLIRFGVMAVQAAGPLTLRREYEVGE